MYKVSQAIDLSPNTVNSVGSRPNFTDVKKNKDYIFGRYQRKPDADLYSGSDQQTFVAPELTDTSKVQLLHFPGNAVKINTDVKFFIKRNEVKGNFEVKVESPTGIYVPIIQRTIDPERLEVTFNLQEAGLYKVHIKCNSVVLDKSPFIIVCITGESDFHTNKNTIKLPVFQSDVTRVVMKALVPNQLILCGRNEFIVDGSQAGANILFVGIHGPYEQCDEVIIKHQGNNIYKVSYHAKDPGNYLIVAKWGDDHIPGSPFHLRAS